ncbi:MAG: glycoside hydrolase family 32 protein [Spirochaetes bacterium]|nr:MAG: glycoside hydrolase family 32 protein [Spirochaetota bacterium]
MRMISETFIIEAGDRLLFRVKADAAPGASLVTLRSTDDGAVLFDLKGVSSTVYIPVEWDLSAYAGESAILDVRRESCSVAECCLYGKGVLNDGARFFWAENGFLRVIGAGSIRSRFARDPHRPLFHFSPVMNWMNDPCGLIRWRGEYHMFYQYHPFSSFWGPMHWGHAVSGDLVHWRYLPVALAPDTPEHADDFSGIFTGSAVDDNGVLTLVYTDHRDTRYCVDRIMQSQSVASSDDGIVFKKFADNPVIASRPDGCAEDFRDPKVWREDGEWRMVLGSRMEGRGQVLLYGSKDLKHWEYGGVLFRATRDGVGMYECPDFFPLGEGHALLASVVEERGGVKEFYTILVTGAFREGAFVPERETRFDFGPDFYAPQSFLDDKGRRIVIAWMENWGNSFLTHPSGWSGAATLPRTIETNSRGEILIRPVEELEALRKTVQPAVEMSGKALDTSLLPVHSDLDLFEVMLEFTPLEKGAHCGLVIAGKDGGEVAVFYDADQSRVVIDRGAMVLGEKGIFAERIDPEENGLVRLHVFCDRSSVEVFAGGYRAAGTARVYFKEPGRRADIFSRGRVDLVRCALWELASAW